MRIAVNARYLIRNRPDGIGNFSFEILRRLSLQHPEHEFIFLFDRPWDPEYIFGENITPLVLYPPARHPLLWFIWFECRIPAVLRKYRPDLFFSPDGFMPTGMKIPSVVVIHDINFYHRPADLPLCSRIYYNHFFPIFAAKAERICTVSEYSKKDIVSAYHISPGKIDMYHNGVSTDFKPLDEAEKKRIRNNHTGGEPYFIFIGGLHPRKNIVNLLKAFDHFRGVSGKKYKLIIAGERLFKTKVHERAYSGMIFRKDIIFTGRIDDIFLRELLAASEALTLVSYFEGFGLPLLEAMMCDVPVITSDRSSMPEIAGNAAIYVNPEDYLSISAGMGRLADSFRLREELIDRGRARRAQFSWDKSAEGIWDTILKTIKDYA